MDIIIPSAGRWNRQPTLEQLSRAGIHPILVVQAHEASKYSQGWSSKATIFVLPPKIRTIAPTRQHILNEVGVSPSFCMLDDDLAFYKRRDDDRTKLRDITPTELAAAFWQIDANLGPEYAHVGFTAREGANRNTGHHALNTRIMRVLGYHRPTLNRLGIRFDDVELMEDFHVALQLLEAGVPNLVLNDYAHNQDGSNVAGGCSTFRTMERHGAAAQKLADLHPRFVTVVEKTTKGAWGGGTRKDVLIQWKKAYAHGLIEGHPLNATRPEQGI